jgi:hypothetical protein
MYSIVRMVVLSGGRPTYINYNKVNKSARTTGVRLISLLYVASYGSMCVTIHGVRIDE